MLEYILGSTFIHVILLLGLLYSSPVNTPSSEKITVNIIEKSKRRDQAPILSTSPKLLKSHDVGFKTKKTQKVDMSVYANRLKAMVDPEWSSHIAPYQPKLLKTYEIIVLLSVDQHGNIYRIRIKKSSGEQFFDDLAVQTFRELGHIPNPPDFVVKDGIIWSLVF